MDPENQDRIKGLVDEHGADDLVVVLGAADLESLEVAAETVTMGDPAYVGPLAGVQLGLPVVHILEEDVKEQVDAGVYDEQVGLLEMTLDVEQVREAARKFPGPLTQRRALRLVGLLLGHEADEVDREHRRRRRSTRSRPWRCPAICWSASGVEPREPRRVARRSRRAGWAGGPAAARAGSRRRRPRRGRPPSRPIERLQGCDWRTGHQRSTPVAR